LRVFIVFLLILAVVAPAIAIGRPEVDLGGPDVVFVNIADTHSAYDSYPVLLAAIEELAESYAAETQMVFLFNGDLFELGVVVASRSEGAADWAFLERLGALGDVIINVGNHEFDFISPFDFVAAARQSGAVVIGTVGTTETPELTPVSTDIVAGTEVIRIVGVGTDQANTYPQSIRDSLEIPAPVDWVVENWSDVVAGADYTVLASHAGLASDVEILDSIGGDDSILFAVGAHDHLTIRESVNGTVYMHNGFRGERFNVTELYRTPTGFVTEFRDVVTASLEGYDEALSALISELREQHLTEEDLAVVGTIRQDFTVLEAARWATEEVRSFTGADAAFLNHSSFGAGLPAGPLPRYRFDQFMRFDNDVMRARVDSETMRTILARANQHEQTDVRRRTGDFLYTNSDIQVRDGQVYDIVTSSWVALDFNQMRYLGTTVEFEQIPGITTKEILIQAMYD